MLKTSYTKKFLTHRDCETSWGYPGNGGKLFNLLYLALKVLTGQITMQVWLRVDGYFENDEIS